MNCDAESDFFGAWVLLLLGDLLLCRIVEGLNGYPRGYPFCGCRPALILVPCLRTSSVVRERVRSTRILVGSGWL